MTQAFSLAGRYLLVEPLGEGGMATVYRAFDQRLQVWRAIKVLSDEYSNKPKLRGRFEAEAQTMALLEHRHIVRVYDVGHDGAVAYIVMELVEGGSLVDWLEANGPMPPRMAVDVMIQVCEGVQAAHDKGVIHRDLKPHNVMITADGLCRVTDFGIARVGDSPDDGMTKTGAVMGTWGYMAPEQRTDAKHVDARADVYALACTLYSLLTDKSPMDLFAADPSDPEMQALDQTLMKLILHAAEYRREDRIASVRDFVVALKAALPTLPDTDPETPALAREPAAPRPPPDPTGFVPLTRPAVHEAGGTIAPESFIVSGNTLAPGTQTSLTPMPISERPSEGSGSGIAALLLALLLVVAGLGAAGVAIAVYVYTSGSDTGVTTAQIEQPLPVPEPVPEPRPDPVPQVEPAPPPVPTAVPTPRPVPGPRPVPAPAPTPDPRPRPVVIAVPSPQPDPAPQPTIVVAPVPAPEPAEPQCIKVEPPAIKPDPAEPGRQSAVFKAQLCYADDSEQLTLHYRPLGGGRWQRTNMPARFGLYVQKITLDPTLSEGVEYYIQGVRTSAGSAAQPKVLQVY